MNYIAERIAVHRLPGLIQSEEYADTIIRNLADPRYSGRSYPDEDGDTANSAAIAGAAITATLVYVLDEAAAQRLVGERNIALGQIGRLISLAAMRNVTIEVVPFSAGLRRGMLETFIILEFPEPEDSDVLFVETSRDMITSRDEAGEISGYREVFEHLRSISLGPDGTLAYLAKLAKQITRNKVRQPNQLS